MCWYATEFPYLRIYWISLHQTNNKVEMLHNICHTCRTIQAQNSHMSVIKCTKHALETYQHSAGYCWLYDWWHHHIWQGPQETCERHHKNGRGTSYMTLNKAKVSLWSVLVPDQCELMAFAVEFWLRPLNRTYQVDLHFRSVALLMLLFSFLDKGDVTPCCNFTDPSVCPADAACARGVHCAPYSTMGSLLEEAVVRSRVACLMMCRALDCGSMYYHEDTKACLVYNDEDPDQVKDETDGWIFYIVFWVIITLHTSYSWLFYLLFWCVITLETQTTGWLFYLAYWALLINDGMYARTVLPTPSFMSHI